MLNNIRLRVLGVLTAMMLIVMGVVNVSPAQAASCATNYICYFNDTAGTDLLISILTTSDTKSVCYSWSGASYNNAVGYIVNNSSHYYYVYDNASCSSTPGTIYPNSSGAMNSTWNNVITSYYRAT